MIAGAGDAFITKFGPGGQTVVYSTFLGGSGEDEQLGAAVDAFGNVYLAGSTTSTDFPTLNAFQPAPRGAIDAFVAKVNAKGNALVYSTYLGGSANDVAMGITVDSGRDAYVVGHTSSTDFPTVKAVQPVNRGGEDVFLTKVGPKGNRIAYSTYLGGSANEGDYAVAVAVGAKDSAYVLAATASSDLPTTASALQTQPRGGLDVFVVKVGTHAQKR